MLVRCAFWLAITANLGPIWAFEYFPSQDGPSHLYNALILVDCISTNGSYHEFYTIRVEAIPNWTVQAILAVLCTVVPALTAEKILLTGHVLLFAFAFRYFISAANPGCLFAPVLALVFVFNRCIWMGFYNFCLSLDVFWLAIGFYLRGGYHLSLGRAAGLALFGLVAYFTHLVGYLLLALVLLALSLLASRRPVRAPVLVFVAMLPAGLLAVNYFAATGLVESGGASRLAASSWQALLPSNVLTSAEKALLALPAQLFGPLFKGPVPVTVLALVIFAAIILFQLLQKTPAPAVPCSAPPKWLWLLVLIGVSGLYAFTPEHIGFEHGGYLKQRFAVLLPLLLLTIVQAPRWPALHAIVCAAALVLLGLTAANALFYVAAANATIRDFTAGQDAGGNGRVMFVVQEQPKPKPVSDPLRHASDYYCLDGQNVNLANYQAATPHFPAKFRRERLPADFRYDGLEIPVVADTVLVWGQVPAEVQSQLASFQLVYASGHLMLFRRN
jgi:hypothetical protein